MGKYYIEFGGIIQLIFSLGEAALGLRTIKKPPQKERP